MLSVSYASKTSGGLRVGVSGANMGSVLAHCAPICHVTTHAFDIFGHTQTQDTLRKKWHVGLCHLRCTKIQPLFSQFT